MPKPKPIVHFAFAAVLTRPAGAVEPPAPGTTYLGYWPRCRDRRPLRHAVPLTWDRALVTCGNCRRFAHIREREREENPNA